MGISVDEVRRIASLARLRLTPDEVSTFAAQIGSILDHFQRLQEVDVEAVGTEPGAAAAATALRPDRPVPTAGAEAALAGAPDSVAGYFRVPRVIP